MCTGGQLDPFQRLFSTILRWQKTEKRIMDGTFLELNAEKTQSEVHTHTHTLTYVYTTNRHANSVKTHEIHQSIHGTYNVYVWYKCV